MSLWINQFELYRVNVLENVINRQRRDRRRTVSTFIEKRDKPALKNMYYTFDGEIFCLTMIFFEEIRKGTGDIFQEI